MDTKQKGFTLVELLVVIAIIGILSTLLLIQFSSARARGRDTQRITAATQIRDAVEQYYDENGSYPTAALMAAPDSTITKFFANGTLPKDPKTGNYYGYAVSGLKYQIYAYLESKNNVLNADADIDASGWSGKNGATETCADTNSPHQDCIYDLGVNQ